MEVPELHEWDVTPAAGRRLQEELADRLRLLPLPGGIRLVAGADVAFRKARGLVFASVVLLRLPTFDVVERVDVHLPCAFPYVPGLLTFREGPAVVEAFRALKGTPDAVVFDGQGFAHPRRMGLAAHMGLWLGLPTVGCAKSRLIGEHAEPGAEKGSTVPLFDGDEQIGEVVRTRTDVKPVYVSPGHLADFETSTRLVLQCCPRYRLPEPTRRAHLAVSRLKEHYLQAHRRG
jgi:deoxyribonuclease V